MSATMGSAQEANLVTQGTMVILAGFSLSFVKAALEKLIPAMLSYGAVADPGTLFPQP